MSFRVAASVLMLSLTVTGCSVSRALNKPSPKDLSFLTRGTSRDAVRSELGDFTLSADTPLCDVHTYPEGSGGGKYARAFLYSILDLGSAGIFEIFLNPIETAVGNEKIRTKTCYNEQNLLVRASGFGRGGKETRLAINPADDPAFDAALDAPKPVPVVVVPPPAPAPAPEPAAVVPADAPAPVTVPVAGAVAPDAVVMPTLAEAPVATPAAATVESAPVVAPVSVAAAETPPAAAETVPLVAPEPVSAPPAAEVAPAVVPAPMPAADAQPADAKPAATKPRKKSVRKS